jgi:uncharacterized protein (DUF362 family)
MQRREFIKRTGQAVALAAVTGGVGLIFHNRETGATEKVVRKQRDFQVPRDVRLPQVVLAKNENHIAALHSSLEGVGGLKRFVKAGERVVIKPNIGWDRTPEQAANTNPDLVAEVVRLCLAAGAAEVIVTDVSCNDPRRCFLRSGIKEAAEKAGGAVRLPGDEDYVLTDLGGVLLSEWPVLKYFLECDRLINMPIVKQHSLCSCTLGMKNFYGILGGSRHQLHQRIDQSIVDLAAFCRPTLVITDATRVLVRNGPTGGSLADVSVQDTVICATDQVAADARAAELLGLQPERVRHISLAAASGLGQLDYRAAGYQETG